MVTFLTEILQLDGEMGQFGSLYLATPPEGDFKQVYKYYILYN